LPPASDPQPAIQVEGLSVRYKTTSEGKSKGNPLSNLLRHARTIRQVEALDEVTCTVPRGSVYAVVGKNGAGKSTLLRVMGGILAPTEGRVSLYGRVSPLLASGLGFNRKLTGRQNIMLGGLTNGLKPHQVKAHEEEIIEFAGLDDAIDSPVRTYSSGMAARLTFAVSVHLEPEILLIDEALSAGDPRFKARCQAKIEQLCQDDVTVVLVTHGMGMVQKLADRCLWLDHGRVVDEGETDDILTRYTESLEVDSSTAVTLEDV
jgi:teichoic acid transport system ATP-binding protein